jgi:hypothetical protein
MATSEKQLAANRENAKKSTGPTTAAGKTRASQNACTHGLTAEKVLMDFIEDKSELDTHRESIIAFYKPQNPMEKFWVDQIILGQWRLDRLARWESAIFNDAVIATHDANAEDDVELEEYVTDVEPDQRFTMHNWMISFGMTELCKKEDYLKIFLRYQSQAERLVRRAEVSIANLRIEPKSSRQRIDSTSTSAAISTNEPIPMPASMTLSESHATIGR